MESSGATIYYTTDGSTPTTSSSKYGAPIKVSNSTYFKAYAIKTGFTPSPVSNMSVVIKEKTVYVDKKAKETPPQKVTELKAEAMNRQVLLTWKDAPDADVYGYEVSFNGTGTINRVVFPALDSKSMMAPKGSGGCYISSLINDTEYSFTVKTVDTSAASTNPASNPKQWGEGENKHACENTSDKIFLLSEKEATTSDYGFPEFNVHGAGNARIRATTDYAKANYAYQDTASNGWWWLRSPYWTGSSEAYGIENGGNAEGRHAPVSRKYWGIVPALRITLP
ncbi:MAG: chitobiase/beta-hexosaminidase C-terminal domain-containing protein [Treponema sp.]|nr:chitobiase/beta-hexosaminidase C-terminal domain-containing protein [Treponema sp.]